MMKDTLLRHWRLLFYDLTMKHQFILFYKVIPPSLTPTLVQLHLVQGSLSQMIAQLLPKVQRSIRKRSKEKHPSGAMHGMFTKKHIYEQAAIYIGYKT